jgi:hypothetical protein
VTGEQPFLFGETWVPIRDGNVTGLSIFLRHYTARLTRKIRQFVGPGGKMVLLTPDARALFVWRKFISDDAQTGVNLRGISKRGQLGGPVKRTHRSR